MLDCLNSVSTKWKQRWYRTGIVVTSLGAILTLRKIIDMISRKYNKYPPGPVGVPIFGSLFHAFRLPQFASYLASSYGPITMIYVGHQPFVFLHRLKDVEAVFYHKDALDRAPFQLALGHLKAHEVNTGFGALTHWHKKRKTFQSIVISHLETTIINKIHNISLKDHVFHSMDSCIEQKKLWFPTDDISFISFNTMWYSAFGSPIKYGDPRVTSMEAMIQKLGEELGKDLILRYLGAPKILISRLITFHAWKDFENCVEQEIYANPNLNYNEKVFDMEDKTWTKHFEQVRKNSDSCIVSRFIAAHRLNPDITSGKTAILQEIMLVFIGMDVLSLCMDYGLILLAKNPKEQEQIYTELKQVFGEDLLMESHVFRNEVHNLHYLRAFIYEVHRLSCIAPIGVPRHNPKHDVWLRDHSVCIPKGSVIMADNVQLHKHDPHWLKKTNGKTSDLCLKAWLDENNRFKYNQNADKVLSFGIGPRECAAKAFAMKTLYLIFAKFALSYKYSLPKGMENVEITQRFEFANRIDPAIGLLVRKR